VQTGEIVTVQGKITQISNHYTGRFKKLQKAVITDSSGSVHVIWFNQPYIVKMLSAGNTVSLSGRIEEKGSKKSLISPQFEILEENTDPIHTGRLVPIYPETKGISSKWLRRIIYRIIRENKENLKEYLPYSIIKNHHLISYFDAIEQINFPDSFENVAKAKHRLSFDEVFLLQLAAVERKALWKKEKKIHALQMQCYPKKMKDFYRKLPFILTDAQKNTLDEIFIDLSSTKSMNRLLEGDVGSGKTVVAAAAMYLSYLNGFQCVLMAPTEILAEQHFKTIQTLLEPLGVSVAIQTSNKKNKKQVDVLIGTHAVISEKVKFDNLGLIVIDEQQRFGVSQRAFMRTKGENPHILTMTATPIPRTVALTLYGDLDLSVLNEMPKGRKKIKTWLVPQEKRDRAYAWITKKVKSGDQVFIVCPFIEESESMQTVKAAAKEFEILQTTVFPTRKLGLLHGKLKSAEREKVLEDFRKGNIDILVATPVVEVGIDIPNATIIVIEAAERFGLSQLHQLRGRVGRGNKESFCLLFSESKNPQTVTRLKAMELMSIGAELAELDLKLRGAGELYGTAQHGKHWLKIASFSDYELLEKARNEARKIFPVLSKYPMLEEKLKKIRFAYVSPD
ncbi:MAG: ATP-dependent DNA helicase RecG, partial [Candidatus Levyibacteriota bacterium]